MHSLYVVHMKYPSSTQLPKYFEHRPLDNKVIFLDAKICGKHPMKVKIISNPKVRKKPIPRSFSSHFSFISSKPFLLLYPHHFPHHGHEMCIELCLLPRLAIHDSSKLCTLCPCVVFPTKHSHHLFHYDHLYILMVVHINKGNKSLHTRLHIFATYFETPFRLEIS